MINIRTKALAFLIMYIALIALAYLAAQSILTESYLKDQMPKEIYYDIGSTAQSLIASLSLAACAIGVICFLIFDRAIFSRLSRLERDVSNAEKGAQFLSRIELRGNDELSSLAESINWMLASLKDSQGKLQESSQFAAIGETAAMVGHDLRNPLQTITGAIYILRTQLDNIDKETMGEMIQHIEQGVSYADKIVRDLLDYSKEPHLELTETKAQQLIDQAMALCKLPNNIRVVERIETSSDITVDADKIKRVFVNIIKNAIDAMPTGGEILVRCCEKDYCIETSFSDVGSGIPAEIMKTIWKPLQTSKARGMGFGLPICKRFVEAHGGTINVETTIGKGTTFTVRLPPRPVLPQKENVQLLTPRVFNQYDIALPTRLRHDKSAASKTKIALTLSCGYR
jgi:signal transduction histidine kinase